MKAINWINLKEFELEKEPDQEGEEHKGPYTRGEEGEDEGEKEDGMAFREGYMIFFGKKEKDYVKTMMELAKEKELNRWRENQVYDEVEQKKGMNIVNTKWIIREKEK